MQNGIGTIFKKTTGQKFFAIQNGSGNGPDGVFIDKSTAPATIYIAEAKSSINGASSARPPAGSVQARLDQWIKDFDGPKYANVDAATRANIELVKDAYRMNQVPKGIWVQVEVPKLNSANIVPLDVIIHEW